MDLHASEVRRIISIHAPLAGCDYGRFLLLRVVNNFNPRTPCGVRQNRRRKRAHAFNFNPRTPCGVRLAENDTDATQNDFNPRTPCGVRPDRANRSESMSLFQSTHPLRGATQNDIDALRAAVISIHAPLAGCDPDVGRDGGSFGHFNPRTPCGVRPTRPYGLRFQLLISIHAPLAGCDYACCRVHRGRDISIHAPLAGCDPSFAFKFNGLKDFNPRTPCGVRRHQERAFRRLGKFQSTHPLRGATVLAAQAHDLTPISIHAPLAGCDCARATR